MRDKKKVIFPSTFLFEAKAGSFADVAENLRLLQVMPSIYFIWLSSIYMLLAALAVSHHVQTLIPSPSRGYDTQSLGLSCVCVVCNIAPISVDLRSTDCRRIVSSI